MDYSSSVSVSASASGQQGSAARAGATAPTHALSSSSATDLRPGQVFAGYPAYPAVSATAVSSMAPSSYNPMDGLGRPASSASGVREAAAAGSPNPHGDWVAEARKRKIEEVDGQQQQQQQQQHAAADRVRLGMQFHHEGHSVSPSSYRTYADFARSSYPPQLPAPATAGRRSQVGLGEEDADGSTMVRTAVRRVSGLEEHGGDDDADAPVVSSWVPHVKGEAMLKRPRHRPGRSRGVTCSSVVSCRLVASQW